MQTIPEAVLQDVAVWAAMEFERRTLLIARDDRAASPYWIVPDQRVSWTEVCEQLLARGAPRGKYGGLLDVVDVRLQMQPLFDREIKRRKLWRVLQNREKPLAWAERTGKL